MRPTDPTSEAILIGIMIAVSLVTVWYALAGCS